MSERTFKVLAFAGAFAVYLAAASLTLLLARPGGVLFPSVGFFFAFCVVPCLASWLLCIVSAPRAVLRVMLALGALVAFALMWRLQIGWVTSYALSQADPRVEGLISNFVVFSYQFFLRSLMVAIAGVVGLSVLSFTLARRWGA